MRHLFLLAALFCACISYAQIRVQERLPKSKTGFALTTAKARAKIYYDANDALVIKRSAELFARDIQMVTGQKPELIQKRERAKALVIVGPLKRINGSVSWRKKEKLISGHCRVLGNGI